MSSPNRVIVENMCKARGVPIDLIDFRALWDSSLSQVENYALIRNEVSKYATSKTTDEVKEIDNKIEKAEELEKEENEKHIDELTEQAIEKAKSEHTPLDKYYDNLERYIRMTVDSPKTHGLLLMGEQGMGKSRNTFKRLSKVNEDFEVVQGHITPKELYTVLEENSGKEDCIVFDDTLELMRNLSSMGLLYSSLNSEVGPRKIQWRSSKGDSKQVSEFNGKIIFIINVIPNGFSLAPLLDRCFPYTLNFSYREKFEMFSSLAGMDVEHEKEGFEVIDFLKVRTTVENKGRVSLRTFNRIKEIRLRYPKCWKVMGNNLLKSSGV